MERSKGDLRNLIVSTNRKPRKTPQTLQMAGSSAVNTPAVSNVPMAMKKPTAMSRTMGS